MTLGFVQELIHQHPNTIQVVVLAMGLDSGYCACVAMKVGNATVMKGKSYPNWFLEQQGLWASKLPKFFIIKAEEVTQQTDLTKGAKLLPQMADLGYHQREANDLISWEWGIDYMTEFGTKMS